MFPSQRTFSSLIFFPKSYFLPKGNTIGFFSYFGTAVKRLRNLSRTFKGLNIKHSFDKKCIF